MHTAVYVPGLMGQAWLGWWVQGGWESYLRADDRGEQSSQQNVRLTIPFQNQNKIFDFKHSN